MLTGGARWRLRCQSGHRPQPRRVTLAFCLHAHVRGDPRSHCMAVLSRPESGAASRVQGFEYMRATIQVQSSLLRPQREAAGNWERADGRVFSDQIAEFERGTIMPHERRQHWPATGTQAGRDGSGCGKGQKRKPAAHIYCQAPARRWGRAHSAASKEPDELRGFRAPSAAKLNSKHRQAAARLPE